MYVVCVCVWGGGGCNCYFGNAKILVHKFNRGYPKRVPLRARCILSPRDIQRFTECSNALIHVCTGVGLHGREGQHEGPGQSTMKAKLSGMTIF